LDGCSEVAAGRASLSTIERNTWTSRRLLTSESLPCANRRERADSPRIPLGRRHLDADDREKSPAIRTLRGWAISVLQEAGAIHECEEHGWLDSIGDTCPECTS
jgi:hypothetical protein